MKILFFKISNSFLYHLLKMLLDLFIGLIIFLLIAIFTVNQWLPFLLKKIIEKKTHFSMSISSSQLLLLNGSFSMNGICIMNPKGRFDGEKFLQVKSIYAQFDYKSFFQKGIVINEAVIVVDNFTIEKNNLDEFNVKLFADSFDISLNKIRFLIKKLYIQVGTISIIFGHDNETNIDLNETINLDDVTPDFNLLENITFQVHISLSSS